MKPGITLALALLMAGACADAPRSGTEGGAEITATGTPPTALDAYAATDSEQAEVVATVQRLFDALEQGDEALLRSVMSPSVVMHYTEVSEGQTTEGSSTVDGLAQRITSSDVALVERMWDPGVVVDGPMATLWAPYDFYVGSDFSHCGIDTATLMRSDDGWVIVGLSWTRLQPPACDLHPEGPPS